MADSVSTPKLPAPIFRARAAAPPSSEVFSSSPGFGTPAYPIASRPAKVTQPFAPAQPTSASAAVLPILLPPQILRPIAFRTLTKKHNLTLTSSGLGLLSTFVGRFCGSGWREEGLAERLLDEVAKSWKRGGGSVLVEDGPDKKLSAILKNLEPCMSGGRLDLGRLSRSNSSIGGSSLSRQNSLDVRPGANREDSQSSLGMSRLEVEETNELDEDLEALNKQDTRAYMKIVSSFNQPRFMYSMTKKSLELVMTPPSYLPPISHKIALFRNRYNLIHQRLMRNESFQTPAFSMSKRPPSLARSASNATTVQQAYKITPVSNLLGRSGSSHLLLGLLVHSPTGDLALTDLSGSVALDLSVARPVPEDGAWFCPGMIVLAEGTYEEDGSNNSSLGGSGGVGGQIKGRFVSDTIAGPPAERRELTLGTTNPLKGHNTGTSTGSGFGWIDLLGMGSEKSVGSQMRRVQKAILGRDSSDDERRKRSKIAIIGECCLDNPRVLDAVRAILTSYNASGEAAERPLSVVLMGNFVSAASMAGSTKGGGSIEYKEQFDALASVLSEFPSLLSNTTFVFVPGDNDPWASSFSAGAAVAIPREAVPEIFTTRIRRAIAAANMEAGKKDGDGPGEAVMTSNPARMTLFGPVEELVLFRDDITGRLRRHALTFSKPPGEDDAEMILSPEESNDAIDEAGMELDPAIQEATSHVPHAAAKSTSGTKNSAADNLTARKLVKSILDQGYLAPFPLTVRPVLWDYGSSLTLYPLPTALVLADSEATAFAVTYEGCHVMNPGRVIDELGARKGLAKYVEYDVRNRKGAVKEVRF